MSFSPEPGTVDPAHTREAALERIAARALALNDRLLAERASYLDSRKRNKRRPAA